MNSNNAGYNTYSIPPASPNSTRPHHLQPHQQQQQPQQYLPPNITPPGTLPPLNSQFVQTPPAGSSGYPNSGVVVHLSQHPSPSQPVVPSGLSPSGYPPSSYYAAHNSPQGIPSTPPPPQQQQQQQSQPQPRYLDPQENVILPPITSAGFARPIAAINIVPQEPVQDNNNPVIKNETLSPPRGQKRHAAAKDSKRSSGPSTVTSTKTKKRRSLSCQTCRKLKTRCDFDAGRGMCHRCFVLRLSCSLATEHIQQPNYLTKVDLDLDTTGRDQTQQQQQSEGQDQKQKAQTQAEDSQLAQVQRRLDSLENSMGNISNQLGTLKTLMESMATPPAQVPQASAPPLIPDASMAELQVLDRYTNKAPLVVIRDIDYKLFERLDKYATMRVAAEDLGIWITENAPRELQIKLVNCFLSKCAPYIVPGSPAHTFFDSGDNEPSLMLGVLMLQGMRCDDECTHDTLQPQLFNIVRSLMGTALMTAPLRLCDIEALLYVAAFNIARKPKQPIFDSWLLTSYAIKLFILSVSFDGFSERANQATATADDLYALRLWNYLCLVHYQYAILTGRPVIIPKQYVDQCTIIFRIPGNTMGDAVVLAEVRLYQALLMSQAHQSVQYLSAWKEMHVRELEADRVVGKDLAIGYEFCLIVFARRFGDSGSDRTGDISASGVGTGEATGSTSSSPTPSHEAMRTSAIESSVRILHCILDLPPSRISGMPNHPLCVLIYAVMTLCHYFAYTPLALDALSLIVRTYWYLCHLGEQSRDIINSIAGIIKSIIQTARKGAVDLFPARAGGVGKTVSVMPLADLEIGSPSKSSQQQQQNVDGSSTFNTIKLAQSSNEDDADEDGEDASLQYQQQSQQDTPQQRTDLSGNEEEPVFEMPDITQYATFDDFFDGVFSYVHQYSNLIST